MQTSSFAWTILLSCFRVLLAPWSWCTTSTNWHQNKMVLLNLLLMLVQVLLEMVKFPRVIIQISNSNWPNPEIKEKNLVFSFSVGLGQAISVCIMFPHGLSAVPLLIHQTSLLPAKKRNTPELAISSWVYTIIIPLLGDVTSVTYSCGICGLSSVESDSCFSEPGSIDLSLESPLGFGEVTSSQGGLGRGICSFSMFHGVMNLTFFSLVLTARSSAGRECIDIPVQLLSCWRCWHITGICGELSL